MSTLNKLVTAIRGGVTEVGEALADSQALRILDQEIRDASEELKQSNNALAAMIAKQKLSSERLNKLEEDIDKHEGYAVKALDQSDESLALDIAKKIAELEASLEAERQQGESFKHSAKQLNEAIAQATKNVQYMKTQVDTVKATENVQKAEAAVSARHSGSNSKLRTAMESLERIKERQAMTGATMDAASDMANERRDMSLEQRLQEAGITQTNDAADVLDRIKKTRSSP